MTSPHFLLQAQTEGMPNVPSMDDKSISTKNGFQPAILTSNVRVPPGHIERVASTNANGKIPINSLLTSPESLPVTPPPRTNAQARTARKSAFHVSTSSRTDCGYSTSSSSNGGRKTISGERDKKERDSLSMSEISSDSPVRIQAKNSLENHKHSPKKFPLPPKPQQVQKIQQPSTNSEESGSTMRKGASSDTPASGVAAGASGEAVPKASSTKRPPIALSETLSSTKPKRQKVATAKAAALAKEPFMNADGTAVKKRRPPGTKTPKDLARERRQAKAIKGSGMFSLRDAIEPNTGATINVAAKPQPRAHPPRPKHLQRQNPIPIQPPRWEVPIGRYLQRQPVSNAQQETSNSSVAPLMTLELTGSFQAATLPPSSKITKTPNNSSSSRTPYKAQGNSVTEAILIDSSPSSVEKNKDNPFVLQHEKRKGLDKPLVYNIPSDGEDSAISLRSLHPEEGPRNFQTRTTNTQNYGGLTGALSVSDFLFTKCVSPHTPPDERKRLYVGIEDIIQRLEFQKDQSKPHKDQRKTLRRPVTWSENREHPTPDNLAVLLRRLCVQTDSGSIITFESWKEDKPKFKGSFILAEDAEHVRRAFQKRFSATAPPEVIWFSEMPVGEETNEVLLAEAPKVPIPGIMSASETSSTSKSSEDSRRTSITSDSNSISADRSATTTQEKGRQLGQLLGERSCITEGSVASDVVQLVGSLSSPLNLQESVICEGSAQSQAICPDQEIEEQSLGNIEEPQEEEGSPSPIENTEEVAEPSSPSNQIQAENSASTTPSQSIATTVTKQAFVSNKRKRKICGRVTVEDFLSESISDKALQLHRASALLKKRQDSDDIYFPRILRLNKEESDIKAELDALNASAKAQEADYKRRSDASIARSSGEGLSLASWAQYRRLIKELRDLQEDYARQTVRLVDRASRIVEEKNWCIAQRKIMQEHDLAAQNEGPSDENTPSTTTTSASSVSDLMDVDSIPVLFPTLPEKEIEGCSMTRLFLRSLIPWSKMQPEPAQGPSPAELEAVAVAAAAEAKKKMRKKKRYRW